MSNEKNIIARIKQKRDTESNWQSKNPKLLNGEVILVDMSDGELRSKIGDGTSTYSQLSFTDEPLRNLIDDVEAKVDEVHDLVGDTSVSEQIGDAITPINTALSKKSDSGHTHSAYVNQNAFSNVTVGSTTIAADSTTDTLTLVAGNNVTLTPDATNDKITIASKDTVYTHPNSGVTAGTYKSVTVNAQGHVTGGSNPTTLSAYGITDAATKTELNTLSGLVGDTAVSEQIDEAFDEAITGLSVSGKTITYTKGDGSIGTITTQDTNTVYTHPTYTAKNSGLYKVTVDGTGHVSGTAAVAKSDITALGIPAQDTTYSAATTSAAGLMSASDKSKLDGIATGANKTTVDSSLSTTSTNPVQNKVVNAAISNLNTLVGDTEVSTQISNAIANKADTGHTHSAANITSGTIAAARLPSASGSAAGITIVYPAASCTTFSSDSGTVTPLAVQKGAKMFAITRPSATTNKAIVRYSNTTGDVQNSKIIIEDVTNTRDTSKQANVLAIPAEGNKKMVYGYCTDQIDGTSFIGGVFDADATEYPYSAGLAIGGTSGNLLWKGTKVATTADLSGYSTTGHTHNYAGSSSAGGSATSAVKLDTSTAGSTTQPVYFNDGKPVATTYTLGASVPPGAKFTDTTYGVVSTTANGLAPKRDGSTTKFLRGDGTWAVPPDTNTTYSAATQSASGLMSAADKTKLDGIATGANNYTYTLPTASSSTLGGVKTTSTVTSTSGLTACPIISGVPYYKDTNTTYTLSSLGAAAASHNHANQNINPQCIELGSGSTSHGGYIDFHFKGNTGDYTSRIIEQKSGLLSILGGLVLNSSAYGSSLPSAGTAGRIFFKKV